MMKRKRLPFLLASSVCVSACAASYDSIDDALFRELSKQRMTPLHAQDPYSTPQLFLRRARTTSPELDRILRERGFPITISAYNSIFGSKSVSLLYADEPTPLLFEKSASTWQAAKRPPSPAVGAHDAFQSPAPSLVVDSKKESLPPESEEKRIQRIAANHHGPKAELSPRGDLVHYVTMEDETLADLARWYTLDGSNSGRLARINHLSEASPLAVGDQVVIPSYLVKNKLRFTEEAKKQLPVNDAGR